MLVLAVLSIAAARWIEKSWIGPPGLAALRADEQAAECSGTPTLKLKLFAATVSGALIASAGAPYPYYASYVEPASAFGLAIALNALAMPLIGGTRSWIGRLVGALFLSGVSRPRDRHHSDRGQSVDRRAGAYQLRRRRTGWIAWLDRSPAREGEAGVPAEPIFSVQGVTKRFDILVAVADVDLDVASVARSSASSGLTGRARRPFIARITGVIRPEQGKITFDGVDISSMPGRYSTCAPRHRSQFSYSAALCWYVGDREPFGAT